MYNFFSYIGKKNKQLTAPSNGSLAYQPSNLRSHTSGRGTSILTASPGWPTLTFVKLSANLLPSPRLCTMSTFHCSMRA